MDTPPDEPPPREATLRDVVATVFSSFLGIRRGSAMRKDAVRLRPHQVILAGIALAAAFVVALILVVRIVIRSAGA
ncbi:MAG TPA: DUF2970 domain-containing protein [Casimicrobiaceae bacterium]|nr:DUF2970 domain-containing protein [Casimicrobiaceae bacterium]